VRELYLGIGFAHQLLGALACGFELGCRQDRDADQQHNQQTKGRGKTNANLEVVHG
jgi:hypothetical protein